MFEGHGGGSVPHSTTRTLIFRRREGEGLCLFVRGPGCRMLVSMHNIVTHNMGFFDPPASSVSSVVILLQISFAGGSSCVPCRRGGKFAGTIMLTLTDLAG